ncbi:MAG TPA: GGDEF domain-containing protein, partial [Candidatus Omnitrophica bacterium]|nr:GGDEF domain-containing protein [Candidatus Omnitrophota bacterium]
FIIYNTLIVTFYPIFSIFASYILATTYTQALQSLEKTRLFNQATRDGLTGLFNVRHFKLMLEGEFKNVSSKKTKPLSVAMSDIDHFKNLNDTHGHQAGDTVLAEIAKIMHSACRATDVVGRYGGEEFIVMFTGADKEVAARVAERIRSEVEQMRFKFEKGTYKPTISLGVAQYAGDENATDDLIKKADTALYEAKEGGRNQVRVYGDKKK